MDGEPSGRDDVQLAANPKTSVFHRSLLKAPDNVTHASGINLHLADGRVVMDACGGAAVAAIGHGNTSVIAAAAKQMRELSYVHTGAYTTRAAEDLAHVLLDGNPYGLEKAIFVGSGSEAMDGALKLARQYFYEQNSLSPRIHFIARRQSWHGTTLGAISLSSNLPRKLPYEPLLLPHVSHVSPAFAYHYQESTETTTEYVHRLAQELDNEFQRIGPEKVIAFVAEPVVGATSGCVAPPPGYFAAVRKVCDKYGALLILDEVMCGVGRTGTYFAFEQEAVVPDILTIGKGLGGGYAPIAAVLAGKRVVDVLRAGTGGFKHGHTYQAHPLSCAIALEVQCVLRREDLVKRCMALGKVLEGLLRAEFEGIKYVGDIRGRGLFWAVEFVEDRESKESFDPKLAFGNKVQLRAFEMGVAVYPGAATVDGWKGDHIIVAPPYTVTERELETIVKIIRKAYDAEETAFDTSMAPKTNGCA